MCRLRGLQKWNWGKFLAAGCCKQAPPMVEPLPRPVRSYRCGLGCSSSRRPRSTSSHLATPATVPLVIVLPVVRSQGRCPSPMPRIESGKMCTSSARSELLPAWGTAVVPT
jgi:hypothetical protein